MSEKKIVKLNSGGDIKLNICSETSHHQRESLF